jgi:hypothetical protein
MTSKDGDEAARKKRAEELRKSIADLGTDKGGNRPLSPREITDRAAEEEARKDRDRDKSP